MMDLLKNHNFFVEMVTFCEVIEAGSFTKAAQKLGIHHTTITRRIQNASAEFKRNIVVTPELQFDSGF
jgi:DNA-binding transcriptional LysR family regulator